MFLTDNLFLLRHRSKLKVSAMAALLKVSNSTYSSYELGITQPNIENVCAIAEFYRVSVHRLLHQRMSTLTAQEWALIDRGFDTAIWQQVQKRPSSAIVATPPPKAPAQQAAL